MKRRSFVKASIITGAAAAALPTMSMATSTNKKSGTEFYELRIYTLKNEAQQKLVEDYFQNAFIPALNRLGSKNIGVFTELKADGQTRIFALIPYNSLDDFLAVQSKLAADT